MIDWTDHDRLFPATALMVLLNDLLWNGAEWPYFDADGNRHDPVSIRAEIDSLVAEAVREYWSGFDAAVNEEFGSWLGRAETEIDPP